VQLKSPNSLMQVTARRDFILNLHVSILSNLPLRSPFPHNFQHLRESIFPSFVSEPIDMSSLSSFSYFHWKLVILAHPSFLHLHSKSKMLYRRHSTFPLSYLLHGISITRHFVRSYLRITHPNLRSSLSFSCVFFCFLLLQGSKTRHYSKISPQLSTFFITKISCISLSQARSPS